MENMEKLNSMLSKKLKEWQEKKINIGIIGESGCGKSTLINAIRGLYPNDEGAAKIDVNECTKMPTPYPFPNNENIILWDLPGVNTPNYPLKDYLNNIIAIRDEKKEGYALPTDYDCYLLCSSTRFKDNDLNLAEEIFEKKGKKLIFVHLKFDEDIQGREDTSGKDLNKTEIKNLMEEIRDDINTNFVKRFALKFRAKIFIVSARRVKRLNIDNPKKYEFNALIEEISNIFEDIKKDAFILSLSIQSKESVIMKCAVLRKRIKYFTAGSGLGGAIPIPGVSSAIDLAILIEEIIFYIYQLNIFKQNLKKYAELYDVNYKDFEEIQSKLNPIFKSTLELDSFISSGVINLLLDKEAFSLKIAFNSLKAPLTDFLIKYFSTYLTANISEEIAKFALPVFGSIIGAIISSYSTNYILNTILDSYEKGLLEFFELCKRKSHKKIN